MLGLKMLLLAHTYVSDSIRWGLVFQQRIHYGHLTLLGGLMEWSVAKLEVSDDTFKAVLTTKHHKWEKNMHTHLPKKICAC